MGEIVYKWEISMLNKLKLKIRRGEVIDVFAAIDELSKIAKIRALSSVSIPDEAPKFFDDHIFAQFIASLPDCEEKRAIQHCVFNLDRVVRAFYQAKKEGRLTFYDGIKKK